MNTRGRVIKLRLIALGVFLFCLGSAYYGSEDRAHGGNFGHPRAVLKLKGSGAHRLKIVIWSKAASIVVSKGHAAAVYSTGSSSINGNRFKANFRRFGRVRVRYRQNLGKSHSRGELGCRMRRAVRPGLFTGEIAFEGEAGYVRVSAGRANGYLLLESEEDGEQCPGSESKEVLPESESNSPYRLRGFTLTAGDFVWFYGGRGALTEAHVWESRWDVPLGLKAIAEKAVPYVAFTLERKSGLLIKRVVATRGSRNTLSVDSGNIATVDPPWPFTGQGRIGACWRIPHWHGNLRVSFPGREVSLIGLDYWVSVRHSGCM